MSQSKNSIERWQRTIPTNPLSNRNLYNFPEIVSEASLAFMKFQELDTEKSDDGTGGWLASDVGMGKTAIVLALVASDAEKYQK